MRSFCLRPTWCSDITTMQADWNFFQQTRVTFQGGSCLCNIIRLPVVGAGHAPPLTPCYLLSSATLPAPRELRRLNGGSQHGDLGNLAASGRVAGSDGAVAVAGDNVVGVSRLNVAEVGRAY